MSSDESKDSPSVGGLRIGWLISGQDGYGVAATIRTIADRLYARGGESVAFALSGGAFLDSLQEGRWTIENLECPDLAASLSRPPRNRFDAYARTLRLLRLNRVLSSRLQHADINALVTRSGGLLSLAGRGAGSARVPTFWYMAGSIPEGLWGAVSATYYRSLVRKYNLQVIGNSKYTSSSLRYRNVTVPHIYVPVDLTSFIRRPDARDDENSRPASGETVFLTCARLSPRKGISEFTEAFLCVAEVNADIFLMIAGEGDPQYQEALRRMIENHPCGSQVRLLGARNDVSELMSHASVVVNPSILPESFGRVPVEGQASGRPVLSTACGGPKETVVDGRTGWLIPEPTVQCMQAGIERALADRSRWDEMGQAGIERVHRHFSGTVLSDRLIDHIARRTF